MNLTRTQVSIGGAVRRGSVWSLVERLVAQGISLLVVPIVARQLSPSDYGLYGIITVVLLILETLSRTGFEISLIQRHDDSYIDMLNAAWTASVVRGVALGLITWLLSIPVAHFYGDYRLAGLMTFAALIPILQGSRSVGLTVLLPRDMQFGRIAVLDSVGSIAGSVVTVATALLLRNAWALLVGTVATNVVVTLLSYRLTSCRCRLEFSLAKWQEMWRFGKWEWVAAIAYSLFHNGDELFVGRALGASALGLYRMGYRVANMATTEGVNAVRKVLFPAFARIQNDTDRLRSVAFGLWELGAFLGVGFSMLLYIAADPLVGLFLGDEWLSMVPSLRVLAFWGGVQVLKTCTSPIFRSVNRPDWWAKSLVVRFGVMAVLIYPLSSRWDIAGVSAAVLIASVVDLPLTVAWMAKALDCPWQRLAYLLVLPILAGGLSLWSMALVSPYLAHSASWWQLVGTVVATAALFGAFTLISDRVMRAGAIGRLVTLAKRAT